MVNESVADPTTAERWVSCEIPGCTRQMPYLGRGAPPKYCGQIVEGLKHTRLNAHRLAKGQIALPSPGSGQAADEVAEQGEVGGGEARPVTAARMTLELLLAEMTAQMIGHEQRMGVLAEQISHAVLTAADADVVAVEVSAAHRAARGEVDRAETERDQAIGQAREARRSAEAAEERAGLAEAVAEEALADVETAYLARDQAISERDELATAAAILREELQASREQADQLREQAAALQHQATELTRQLDAQRTLSQQQHQRAESAERHAIRATAQAEQLSTDLSTARAQREHWQAQTADVRAELAGVCSQLSAAQTAAQIEKDHADQRLADQQTHYDELISELRARLSQPQPPHASQDNP